MTGLEQVDQHAHEAVHGVGRDPVGSTQVGRNGEESAKDERVAVEQVKGAVSRRRRSGVDTSSSLPEAGDEVPGVLRGEGAVQNLACDLLHTDPAVHGSALDEVERIQLG